MPNRKPNPLLPACAALAWASAAVADNSATPPDGGNLALLAVGGAALLLIAIVAWRSLARRNKKEEPDPAGFMTLEQITRLESPGDPSPLVKMAQPKPMGSRVQARAESTSQPPSPSDVYMSELEKQYPRIVEKLVTMWPSQESEKYLQSLSIDERGDREGFNRDVAAEIMLLYSVKAKSLPGHIWG